MRSHDAQANLKDEKSLRDKNTENSKRSKLHLVIVINKKHEMDCLNNCKPNVGQGWISVAAFNHQKVEPFFTKKFDWISFKWNVVTSDPFCI